MHKKLAEERIYERLDLPIKVDYEVCTRPKDCRKSFTKNISGGGICLSLLEKLLPETRVKINVNMGQKEAKQTYEINGQVVWTRNTETRAAESASSYYDTGIRFTEVDPVAIGKIVSYHYTG